MSAHDRIILGNACDEWGIWTPDQPEKATHISMELHEELVAPLIEALEKCARANDKKPEQFYVLSRIDIKTFADNALEAYRAKLSGEGKDGN